MSSTEGFVCAVRLLLLLLAVFGICCSGDLAAGLPYTLTASCAACNSEAQKQ